MASGQWETLIEDWPTVELHHRAIHLILLYHQDTWKVLAFGSGEGPRDARTTTCHLIALNDINEPSEAEVIVNPWTDLFCAGHCHLANGDVLVSAGGFIPGHYLPVRDMSRLDLTAA